MIRPLHHELQSRICSGLTITTYTQCVEELVLNSIDAESSCVAVRIDFEKHKIQVVDNGHGISPGELCKMGKRHHTSKCHKIQDLDNLQFYGYRGEAVASICNVSERVEIVSRQSSSKTTCSHVYHNGHPGDISEVNSHRPSQGTTVTASAMFYNMPVRRKTLNEVLELEDIRYRLECIALIHPNVSISLRDDQSGNTMLKTHKSNSILGAFTHLYGPENSQILEKVHYEREKLLVDGYIGTEPNTNKSLQFVYVNKRLVLNTRIHKVVNNILRNSLILSGRFVSGSAPNSESPTRRAMKHGIYVLDITCPLNSYDITFEPSKTLIEFKNWQHVLKSVHSCVKDFLQAHNLQVGLSSLWLDTAITPLDVDDTSQDSQLLDSQNTMQSICISNLRNSMESLVARRNAGSGDASCKDDGNKSSCKDTTFDESFGLKSDCKNTDTKTVSCEDVTQLITPKGQNFPAKQDEATVLIPAWMSSCELFSESLLVKKPCTPNGIGSSDANGGAGITAVVEETPCLVKERSSDSVLSSSDVNRTDVTNSSPISMQCRNVYPKEEDMESPTQSRSGSYNAVGSSEDVAAQVSKASLQENSLKGIKLTSAPDTSMLQKLRNTFSLRRGNEKVDNCFSVKSVLKPMNNIDDCTGSLSSIRKYTKLKTKCVAKDSDEPPCKKMALFDKVRNAFLKTLNPAAVNESKTMVDKYTQSEFIDHPSVFSSYPGSNEKQNKLDKINTSTQCGTKMKENTTKGLVAEKMPRNYQDSCLKTTMPSHCFQTEECILPMTMSSMHNMSRKKPLNNYIKGRNIYHLHTRNSSRKRAVDDARYSKTPGFMSTESLLQTAQNTNFEEAMKFFGNVATKITTKRVKSKYVPGRACVSTWKPPSLYTYNPSYVKNEAFPVLYLDSSSFMENQTSNENSDECFCPPKDPYVELSTTSNLSTDVTRNTEKLNSQLETGGDDTMSRTNVHHEYANQSRYIAQSNEKLCLNDINLNSATPKASDVPDSSFAMEMFKEEHFKNCSPEIAKENLWPSFEHNILRMFSPSYDGKLVTKKGNLSFPSPDLGEPSMIATQMDSKENSILSSLKEPGFGDFTNIKDNVSVQPNESNGHNLEYHYPTPDTLPVGRTTPKFYFERLPRDVSQDIYSVESTKKGVSPATLNQHHESDHPTETGHRLQYPTQDISHVHIAPCVLPDTSSSYGKSLKCQKYSFDTVNLESQGFEPSYDYESLGFSHLPIISDQTTEEDVSFSQGFGLGSPSTQHKSVAADTQGEMSPGFEVEILPAENDTDTETVLSQGFNMDDIHSDQIPIKYAEQVFRLAEEKPSIHHWDPSCVKTSISVPKSAPTKPANRCIESRLAFLSEDRTSFGDCGNSYVNEGTPSKDTKPSDDFGDTRCISSAVSDDGEMNAEMSNQKCDDSEIKSFADVSTLYDKLLCKKTYVVNEPTETGSNETWKMVLDDKTGKYFYINLVTGNSSEHKPSCDQQEMEKGDLKGSFTVMRHPLLTHNAASFLCQNRTRSQPHSLGATPSALANLLEQHRSKHDVDSYSKWTTDSGKDIDTSETSSIVSLLQDWTNPVFKRRNTGIIGSDHTRVNSLLNQCRFTKDMFNNVKVLGQVDNKFIACMVDSQGGRENAQSAEQACEPDLLVLFDQHAVHERVRVEQILEDMDDLKSNGEKHIQQCEVSPTVTIQLTAYEIRVAKAYWKKFANIGVSFMANSSQESLVITALPNCLMSKLDKGSNGKTMRTSTDVIQTIVRDYIQLLQATKGAATSLPKSLTHVINTQACRGAIKFGDPLSLLECQSMLESLSRCNLPFQCAHGRPSVVPLFNVHQFQQQQVLKDVKPSLWKLHTRKKLLNNEM